MSTVKQCSHWFQHVIQNNERSVQYCVPCKEVIAVWEDEVGKFLSKNESDSLSIISHKCSKK